jgi:hypothetical protein
MDDVLSRLQNLKDGATTLAGYTYLGSGTVVRLGYPQPQVRLDLWGGGSGYAGMDDFGRNKDQRWVNYNTSTDLDRFQYAYDRNSSRLYEQNALSASRSELYHANGASGGYDSLDRLAEFRRGTLSDANSDNIPDTVTTASRTQAWTLDPTGNWSNDKRTPTPFPPTLTTGATVRVIRSRGIAATMTIGRLARWMVAQQLVTCEIIGQYS